MKNLPQKNNFVKGIAHVADKFYWSDVIAVYAAEPQHATLFQ